MVLLTVKVKGNVMKINDRSKGTIMNSNKLFEKLDKLDSYTVGDPNEEITISKISLFNKNKNLEINLLLLPDKSLKIFNINDIVFGYLYFQDSDCESCYNEFFDNFNTDADKDKISTIKIKYPAKDLVQVNVSWNSLIYELDSGYNILLFMGTLFNEKGI